MFNKKEKLTLEELAEVSYYFAKKFGIDWIDHEMAKEHSPFKNVDKNVFAYERVIMIFWIIDMIVADEERKLMGAIHKIYLEDIGLLDNPEDANKQISFIVNRYREYYDAWNDKAGAEQTQLGSVIAKNILQEDKPILNSETVFTVATDVLLLMKQAKELIIDKYELVN